MAPTRCHASDAPGSVRLPGVRGRPTGPVHHVRRRCPSARKRRPEMTTPMRSDSEGRRGLDVEPAELTAAVGGNRPCGEPTWRGVPVAEAIEDYRLACLAQAVDDRQLTLHKQGAAPFHISGAGHEALLVGLARSLRAGYDWFFPYYRDLALALALGVTPDDVILQCVGAAADPASGGRQMPSHWGSPALHIVTQSSATGSQCLPAIGCAEAGRYIASHNLAGIDGPRRRGDLRLARRRGDLGGRVLGEPQHRLPAAPADRLRRRGQRLRDLGPGRGPGPGAGLRPRRRLPRPRGREARRLRLLHGPRTPAPRRSAGLATEPARCSSTPTSSGCSSHSSSDDQTRYRSAAEIADDHSHDPVRRLREELVESGFLDAETSDRHP